MSLPREFLDLNYNPIPKRLQETTEIIRKEFHNYKNFLLVPFNPLENYSPQALKQIQGGIVVKALNKSEAEDVARHYFNKLNMEYIILEIDKVD